MLDLEAMKQYQKTFYKIPMGDIKHLVIPRMVWSWWIGQVGLPDKTSPVRDRADSDSFQTGPEYELLV
jgi:hypothetical protein